LWTLSAPHGQPVKRIELIAPLILFNLRARALPG
jgi:hypothetical protein